MSTSIAALPAYKASKATRTKARANRTIFGTTLDTSRKAKELLQSARAQSAAQRLFEERHKKWETPTPTNQVLIHGAWGVKNYSQAEIGEEHIRGYSRATTYSGASSVDSESPIPWSESASLKSSGCNNTKPPTPLIAYKDRYGVYNVLTYRTIKQTLRDKWDEPDKKSLPEHIRLRSAPEKRHNGKNIKPKGQRNSTERRRRMSSMSSQGSSMGGAKHARKTNNLAVPKYHFLSSERNYMRTASLKITETGAKDLINAEPINKIGLGNTLQYNHESFKKRQSPNQYRNLGNVFSLGQRGNSVTTNCEVTGPGGFYEMTTPERMFNERHSRSEAGSEYTMPYEPKFTSRRTYDAARKKKRSTISVEHASVATPVRIDDVIPLNIIHKFGSEEVKRLLKGNEQEVKQALEEARNSNLSHTGVVPPRIEVPELNHPIDPSPAYHSNYGQSLKYDKFEGGLHLYIN